MSQRQVSVDVPPPQASPSVVVPDAPVGEPNAETQPPQQNAAGQTVVQRIEKLCNRLMRGMGSLLLFGIGCLLHIFDLLSDIRVAVKLQEDKEWVWFSLTVAFIFLPVIIMTIAGCLSEEKKFLRRILYFGYRYVKEFKQWKSQFWDKEPCPYRCTSCDKCKPYFNEKPVTAETKYNFTFLRYIETVAESAPQLCLQIYIMMRQWAFPRFVIASSCFSLLALTWSITALERARIKKLSLHGSSSNGSHDAQSTPGSNQNASSDPNESSIPNDNENNNSNTSNNPNSNLNSDSNSNDKQHPNTNANSNRSSNPAKTRRKRYVRRKPLTFFPASTFFFWQLLATISRLSAIVFCAYALRLWMLLFFPVHLILSLICYTLWFDKKDSEENALPKAISFLPLKNWAKNRALKPFINVLTFLFPNLLLLFNVSEPLLRLEDEERERSALLQMNVSHAFQNILMLITSLFYRAEDCDLTNMNVIIPIEISCVVGGMVIGNILCLFYYAICLGNVKSNSVSPENVEEGEGP